VLRNATAISQPQLLPAPCPARRDLSFAEQHTPRPTIGVIGLGTIGGGIASNVHAAALALVVCDVRAETTHKHTDYAGVVNSPADLARESVIVVVAVVNDEQVRAVLWGPKGALVADSTDTTVVVVSTITPACVAAIGAEAIALGVPIIDCGVSGGPSAPASGNLVCMCGGGPEVIAGLAPLFEAIGSLTVTMGPSARGWRPSLLATSCSTEGGWLHTKGRSWLRPPVLNSPSWLWSSGPATLNPAAQPTLMFRNTAVPFTPADDHGLVGAMQAAASLARKDLQADLALADELDIQLPVATMTEARCADIFGVEVPPTE
jgi:6-phosphogluconate dehydrogenase-like protein